MEVLKIATAGSVDDGKSTLIGRLLYDTKSLTDDKLEAIELSSKRKGFDYLDLSLATDGLIAEREQGITIDVAHIYFSTNKKSYIIADTPGHVEYTRNMVTGASTSQASIILIDARHGVIEQTYRHFFINNLLRVKDVIVAINKMDLVDFSEDRFNEIKSDFEKLVEKSDYDGQSITFVPVSALQGDNIVYKSDNTPWYSGQTLLEHLELLDTNDIYSIGKVRFPVQNIIRPKIEEFRDFRGYAGKVYGNKIKVGDEVVILPTLIESKIKSISFYDKQYEEANQNSSVILELEGDINISRGNMIVKKDEVPIITNEINAKVSWLDSTSLLANRRYIVQHGVNKVLAKTTSINGRIKTDFSGVDSDINELNLNDIGFVSLKLNKPLFIDSFKNQKSNGTFIIIDIKTNNTVGVGFIE